MAAAQSAHCLQLDAYANPQSADRLLERLKADKDVILQGVEKVEAEGLIKVQAGPLANPDHADQAAIRLTSARATNPIGSYADASCRRRQRERMGGRP